MIKVVFADDEELVRSGLRAMLADASDIRVVGEAHDAPSAVEVIQARRPDVALLDIKMSSDDDGIQALGDILASAHAPTVGMLITFDVDEYVSRALYQGANGFLLKNIRPVSLIQAIRDLADGGAVIDPGIAARMVRAQRDGNRAAEPARELLESLSEREREVVTLIAQGLSNSEIGSTLFLAEATVKGYVSACSPKSVPPTASRPRCSPTAVVGSANHSQAELSMSRNTVTMRVLVVDDDRAVRESLRRSLEFNGYTVELASDGTQAMEAINANRPDALVLDVMMPRLDGLEVARRLRSSGDDLPILVLTARDTVSDRVSGLDAGADDYLPKPFALEELLARLRALLRRATAEASGPEDPTPLTFSDLTLDPATREVVRGQRSISLTRTEFALLEMLMLNPKRVLTRARILEEVWGFDFPTSGNALEVYIGYLRRKTEADDEPRLIHTVRGVGYVLRETPP